MKLTLISFHRHLCILIVSYMLLTISLNTYAQTLFSKNHVPTFHFEPTTDYLPTESKLNTTEYTEIAQIRNNFNNPGTDYATVPLWVWNDLLTEEQIRSTLADLNKQHVNMAFVHPRPGLATPYLSDEWFKLWNFTLDEAQKRNMKIWIYDENSYPSGFAGGFVPDAFPEYRGTGLDVVFLDELVDDNNIWLAGESVAYVIEQLQDGSTKNRTSEVLKAHTSGIEIPSKSTIGSRWIVGRIQYSGVSQWFGGKTFVNLMEKGALDAFIGFTHESYRRHFGEQFGKIIPGVFTDEPQVASAGMFSWCSDFPQEFQQRRGYDIIPHLGSLIEPIGEWKKVRYDYFKTVLEVFIARWHKPLSEYCEHVGLEYTGHDWEHEWPRAHYCPDNMATAFWRQRPAIDLLMNNFSRGTHAQFGNVRAVRELNSITRQAGRCRSISENYGAGGYDIKFEDLKRLGDWSYALGVNTTDEHLSYISIRGARKHDHPQTFSYHAPWFEQYSKLEDYWTRLSYVLSRGTLSHSRFLLIEPTSTTWLYQQNAGPENADKCEQIGNDFANLLNQLEAVQLDYDLGSEDVISRIGSVKEKEFCVGFASYDTVVLCNSTENLDFRTVELLSEFTQNGGQVISLNAPLELINGLEISHQSLKIQKIFESLQSNIKTKTIEELTKSMLSTQQLIVIPSSNGSNTFHQLRETQDALILFVCNIDLNESASGQIVLNDSRFSGNVESFEPLTGKIRNYTKKNNDGILDYTLSPCSSLLLLFSKEKAEFVELPTQKSIYRLDPWKLSEKLTSIVPFDDNVLVLDYMTVKLNDETIENEYFYRANSWFWNKKGYHMSPWDNGVQFKDELISKKFDDESGFEILYEFNMSDEVIDNLRFVVETPSLYQVFCNDQQVNICPNTWKFDRSFGVFNISNSVKKGKNIIKLVASKSTIFCEIMPAWIVGKFSLEPAEKGFRIVADKGITFRTNKESTIQRASSALEGVSWLSSGVNFSNNDDRAPCLVFQLKKSAKIKSMKVWNYCETNLSKRGIKSFELNIQNEKGESKNIQTLPKTFELSQGNTYAQTIEFEKALDLVANDKLIFTIKSNWNGITYPLDENFVGTTALNNDNAFVGLAEIQFLDVNSEIVKATVSASSELVFRNHDRKAQYTVDSSGLCFRKAGWALQGYPFYSGAVDYNYQLSTSEYSLDDQICFELPDRNRWEAAVIAVLVDEKQVGSIGWQGETVDLTSSIQKAIMDRKNTINLKVRVYGTPKNLFGPHHAGQLRGSAWPGSFHNAPTPQPPGTEYDVIEYGLF